MKKVEEQHRGDIFCDQISTAIWQETASPQNPYLTQEARCHGYEHLALINNRSFSDVLFLLFRGELPTGPEQALFERLLLSCIHPGPRHAASRAAMNAAVSQTHSGNLLPLALSVFSGEWQGSREVFQSMQYLSGAVPHHTPQSVLEGRLSALEDTEEDITLIPGFGTVYREADPYAARLANNILQLEGCGPHLRWAATLVSLLTPYSAGWHLAGLAAATLLDLGFSAHEGELIFQIASAPGIAAQAAEKVHKPITDMPFLPEANYDIEQ